MGGLVRFICAAEDESGFSIMTFTHWRYVYARITKSSYWIDGKWRSLLRFAECACAMEGKRWWNTS